MRNEFSIDVMVERNLAVYRELVRVPLVVRLPGGGRAAGEREVDALTSHVDLPHTITDLLGVERMPLPADRVSLEPWLRAPDRRWRGVCSRSDPESA